MWKKKERKRERERYRGRKKREREKERGRERPCTKGWRKGVMDSLREMRVERKEERRDGGNRRE